ncbi:MAG TPA: septum site-determining protein MinC [Kofleriaceae bacterium]|nr:septum site-determining protein MinC [Kofleriaceae bacterium]
MESVIDEASAAAEGPTALLRGTSRGLEMLVDGRAAVDTIIDTLTARLDEAPGFWKGSNVRIAVEHGPLPAGCLAKLDELAVRFALSIVEVGAAKAKDPVPKPNLAAGSGPTGEAARATTNDGTFGDEEPTGTIKPAALLAQVATAGLAAAAEPVELAPTELTEMLAVAEPEFAVEEPTQSKTPISLAAMPEIPAPTEGTRLVIGPVRSGVILEHEGHLFIFGDVNPGAEVRATGNIIVLGRLRGTAHAAIGQDVGFILALRLEPQQLRIGRRVTRAGDDATPPSDAEIAYLAGDAIVVERYTGKLPKNLATSI